MPRMSVKSIKPIKGKKKKSRFSLKKSKEGKAPAAEFKMEGPPAKLDFSPVDVEFAFPKFSKLRKGKKASAEGGVKFTGSGAPGGIAVAGRKKKRIKFPRMKTKGKAAAKGDVSVETPKAEAKVTLPEGKADLDVLKAKAKVKGKSSKFGISFPKTKKPKVDVSLPEGGKGTLPKPEVEIKGKEEVKFKPPKAELEIGLPSDKVKGPKVDIMGYTEGSEGTSKGEGFHIKMPKIDVSTKAGGEIEGPEGKMKMPKLPQIELSLPSAELEEAGAASVEIPEGKHKAGLKMPSIDITAPKVDIDLSLPKGKAEIEGEVKLPAAADEGLKIKMPRVELPKFGGSKGDMEFQLSPPKVEGDIKGPKIEAGEIEVEGKGPKMKVPSFGISLPKMKGEHALPEAEVTLPDEGSKGKMKMPVIDISLPTPEIHLHLPKGKRADVKIQQIDIEGPEAKGAKITMPKVDISLPKIKAPDTALDVHGMEIEGPSFKGPKISMPKVDISLPKIKAPEGDFEGRGIEIEGPKISMPKVDISLPKMKSMDSHFEVEGSGAKGEKISMPKVDISLPKMKTPEMDFEVEGQGEKGSKISMPKVDISLPKMKSPKMDFEVEGPGAKGAKISKPKVDISLPKMKSPEMDFEVEGPGAKGAKISMPKVDISLPKMKLPEVDFEVEGPGAKGAKLSMPKIDFSLPKMKSPEMDFNVEGLGGKGAKIGLPKVDISLPKMQSTDADIEIEGPGTKGAKMGMPKIDISLPKMKLPEAELDLKGKELEGPDTKGLKMSMPKIDISLPKMKSKEGEYDVQGMDIKGPSAKGPKMSMPKVDISLPKVKFPEADMGVQGPAIEGPDAKGPKISVPKVDIALPKGKLPEGEVSIPEGKLKVNVKGPTVGMDEADGRLSMPSVKMPTVNIDMPMIDLDLSLPKVKGKDTSLEQGVSPPDASRSFEMPDVQLKMPKIPVPKFGVKGKDEEIETDLGLQGDMKLPKGKFDVSHPEMEAGIKPPKIKLDMKGPEFDAEGTDAKLKLPSVKMPKLDISTPKLPDVDLNIKMPKGAAVATTGGDLSGHGPELSAKGPDVHIKMPKLPTFGKGKGETDIKAPELDIEAPDYHFKGPEIKMPKFGMSFPKGKQGGFDIEGEAGMKSDVDSPKMKVKGPKEKLKIEGPDIDTTDASMKLPTLKRPTVDISVPKVDLDFALPRVKGYDKEQIELLKAEAERPSSGASFEVPDISLKMPKFSFPKMGAKSKSTDLVLEGHVPKGEIRLTPPRTQAEGRASSVEIDAEGKVKSKIKMPKMKMPSFGITKKGGGVGIGDPEAEAKVKKGKVDVKGHEISVEGPEGKVRTPKLKFPKFKISTPKGKVPDREADLKVDSEASVKGGMQAPDVTIKMPKFSMPKFGSKEGDLDVGPSDASIEGKSKIKMPSLEISLPAVKQPEGEVLLPKAEVDVSEEDIKGYEGHLKIPKMPTIEISAPKIELDVGAKTESDGKYEGPDFTLKMPKVSLPTFGISGSKEKDIELDISGAKPDMSTTQKVNIKVASPDLDIEGGEGKLKMPKIQLPKVDISVPKGKSGDAVVSLPEGEVDTGEGRFKMPSFGLPKFSVPTVKAPDFNLELSGGKGKHEHEISYPELNVKGKKVEGSGPTVDVDSSDFKMKMPKIKMPSIGIAGPDFEGTDIELDIGLPKADAEKGKIKVEPPKGDIDVSGSSGKIKGPKVKGTKFNIGMPKNKGVMDAGLEAEIKKPEVEEGDAGGRFKIKMPKFGGKGTIEVPELEADVTGPEGDARFKMPKMSLPDIGFSVSKEEGPDASLDTSHPKIDLDSKGGLKVKGPKVDLPQAEFDGPESSSKTGRFKLPDVELSGPKIKGHGDLDIRGREADLSHLEDKERIKLQMPKISLPSVGFSDSKELIVPEGDTECKMKGPKFEIKAPQLEIKVPELDIKAPEFQIKSPQIEMGDPETKEKKVKAKIPKFGIALPSITQPEADVSMSAPDVTVKGPDVKLKKDTKAPEVPSTAVAGDGDYEGPKMPKVKKAVFVFVKPKTNGSDASASHSEGEASLGSTEAKYKVPKIKMKPSFGKSNSKSKGAEFNGEAEKDSREEDGKSKAGKLKMPKVTFSPGKTGSFDVTLNGSGSAGSKKEEVSGTRVNSRSSPAFQNGSQEDKSLFGKLKLPQIEFSSPYPKVGGGEGDAEMSMKLVKTEDASGSDAESKGMKFKSPKISFPGFKKKMGEEEKSGALVSSKARTEMVLMEPEEREGSESPKVSIGFVSGRVRGDPKSTGAAGSYVTAKTGSRDKESGDKRETEVKDKSPRFKIPKFSLSPRSTGILHITTEGSPKSSRDSLQRSEDEERSSGFKMQMPRIGFSAQHTSEEQTVTAEEGSVAIVTKTSKHTLTESGTDKSTTI
ncbi:AHNK protein, partial [Amia calva]|nr:AHNK protein [Amia calva]